MEASAQRPGKCTLAGAGSLGLARDRIPHTTTTSTDVAGTRGAESVVCLRWIAQSVGVCASDSLSHKWQWLRMPRPLHLSILHELEGACGWTGRKRQEIAAGGGGGQQEMAREKRKRGVGVSAHHLCTDTGTSTL
eukprot:3775193-Rhodomonas_salina.2